MCEISRQPPLKKLVCLWKLSTGWLQPFLLGVDFTQRGKANRQSKGGLNMLDVICIYVWKYDIKPAEIFLKRGKRRLENDGGEETN
jgi:hypothetical protein